MPTSPPTHLPAHLHAKAHTNTSRLPTHTHTYAQNHPHKEHTNTTGGWNWSVQIFVSRFGAPRFAWFPARYVHRPSGPSATNRAHTHTHKHTADGATPCIPIEKQEPKTAMCSASRRKPQASQTTHCEARKAATQTKNNS